MILRDSESHSTQIWIAIGLIGGVMIFVGALSPRMRAARDPMGSESLSYNYEMPRVETEDMPFDLSDREVSRRIRELEALKKKKIEAVKAADQAKAKAAAEAAKKAAAEKAKATAAAAARSKAMSVSVTEASERFKMTSGPSHNGDSSEPTYNQMMGGYLTPGKATTPKKEVEDDTLELSAAQWRALLMADPSGLNIAKLLKSRAAGKVDEATIVEIVRDLLKDGADDRKKAGVTLVAASNSAAMFEFLVKEKAEFGAAIQSELQVHIEAYSSPNRLIYLGPILASSTDAAVLTVAMEQLTLAVTNYKKAQSGNISQGTGAPPSLGQLQIFIATLNLVSANEDSSVAQLAHTLAQDIQGLRSTANVASTSLHRRNQVATENE